MQWTHALETKCLSSEETVTSLIVEEGVISSWLVVR